MDFNESIEVELPYSDESSYYTLEEVYQAFKERLAKEPKSRYKIVRLGLHPYVEKDDVMMTLEEVVETLNGLG